MKPEQIHKNGTSALEKAEKGAKRPKKGGAQVAVAENESHILLKTLVAFKRGDFSIRMPVDRTGVEGKIADTLNEILELNQKMCNEFDRISRVVGKEGKITQRASIGPVTGSWSATVDSVNSLIPDLVQPSTEVARVIGAVAKGDLSQTMALDVDGRPLRGEFLHTARVVNTMVDQLNSFASEVTRVAREVGTEGKLGGQAEVKGVAGTWKDLTDNVNFMAANLTTQVRGIVKVVTAVANGDLKRKLVLETKGEIAELADTINEMIDTLATFADQVTTVAREVGIEGKLGGQARVPGAAGIWRDLTDNVNQLAATLTNQLRAIAEVATAVTKGDLTRSIAVEAQGEVAALKDNINEMILNLAATTRKNNEQDWLKTNIAKVTGMMQGQRDLLTVAELLLSELTPLIGAQRGTFYIAETVENQTMLTLLAGYALGEQEEFRKRFRIGQGLVGQCAKERVRILATNVPGDYIRISSSLGGATPLSIVVLPVLFEGEAKAVIELASFNQFSEVHLAFFDQLTQSIGIVLNTIAAMTRTEQLLTQSQALAEELQSHQLQLQKTNAELQEKAQLLAEQKTEVETKNQEVEQAKKALEEKAEQLSLTSKYKSEFLANMSHELRTPLNNLLILARMLSENSDRNLTPKQVKFAETIHTSGTDLLALISDILDLSKIESGKVDVEIGGVRFSELQDYCAKTFRHVADGKGLDFTIDLGTSLGQEIMHTDAKRLQQVLKNLLSNALKFTEHGSVRLSIDKAASGWTPGHTILSRAKNVIAFSVADTGIGIQSDKQKVIFEAFQQADGTTSRKYGGTGLGLSISRELARLLGGEIRLQSAPGVGSTFTLYLPQTYITPAQLPKSEALKTTPVLLEQAAAVPAAAMAGPASADGVDLILPSSPEDQLRQSDPELTGKTVLVVDDDVRNIFALTSLLEDHHLNVLHAENGRAGIELLHSMPKIDLVLMDIMMPEMDGYETMKAIRQEPQFRSLPIIALTAKAMKGDRGKCIAAGASDYISKPVDLEQLFSVLRVWISRDHEVAQMAIPSAQ